MVQPRGLVIVGKRKADDTLILTSVKVRTSASEVKRISGHDGLLDRRLFTRFDVETRIPATADHRNKDV
jgi:hypothetical protein